MSHYKIFIRGSNFWLDLDGQRKRFGFYTTRFVEAHDEAESKIKAIKLIQEDEKLKETLNESFDLPKIFIEKINKIKPEKIPPGTIGYAFFSDEEN